MNHSDQYQPGGTHSDTERLLASLIPDTPAALTPPAPAAVPSVEMLLEMARRQGVLEARLDASNAVPMAYDLSAHRISQAPAVPAPAPIVPRWAVGTAVAAVGVGGGAFLVSLALPGIVAGAAALVAGVAAALPFLVVGGVAVACMVGRRKQGKAPSISITQSITNSIRIGE